MDYVMETSESEGDEGMEPRVTSDYQDENDFPLIPRYQTCGSKAKQGELLEAWHRTW